MQSLGWQTPPTGGSINQASCTMGLTAPCSVATKMLDMLHVGYTLDWVGLLLAHLAHLGC